jgi:heptosyltransferase III
MKILVLRGGAVGDFVVTIPAIAALRRHWPGAHLELVAYPRVADLALAGGLADRVVSLDSAPVARLFSPVASTGCGAPAIPPAEGPAEVPAVVARASGLVAPGSQAGRLAPRRTPVDQSPRGSSRDETGNSSGPESGSDYFRSFDLIVSYLHDPDGIVTRHLEDAGARRLICGSPIVSGCHAVEHLMKPLREIGIAPGPGESPRLTLGEPHLAAGRARVSGLGRRPIAIHPGSGSPSKNWPLDRFAELAARLRAAGSGGPLFLLGEAEREAGERLREMGWECEPLGDPRRPSTAGRGFAPAHARSSRATGQDASPPRPGRHRVPVLSDCTLLETAEALSACAAYVGNDSGITHLAAALGVPVVALFGPTDPALWGPRGPKVTILRAGSDTRSMEKIGVEEVCDVIGH